MSGGLDIHYGMANWGHRPWPPFFPGYWLWRHTVSGSSSHSPRGHDTAGPAGARAAAPPSQSSLRGYRRKVTATRNPPCVTPLCGRQHLFTETHLARFRLPERLRRECTQPLPPRTHPDSPGAGGAPAARVPLLPSRSRCGHAILNQGAHCTQTPPGLHGTPGHRISPASRGW